MVTVPVLGLAAQRDAGIDLDIAAEWALDRIGRVVQCLMDFVDTEIRGRHQCDGIGENLRYRKRPPLIGDGVVVDQRAVELMEMKLLRYLVEHAGQVVSRKTILEDVWGLAEDTDTRAIDNFIVRLRKYLEDDPANPKIVRTVRGVGYRLEPGGETQRPT